MSYYYGCNNVSSLKKNECSGCGACAVVCSQKCITMSRDREGFLYPVVDTKCISCGKCLEICKKTVKRYKLAQAHCYATYAKEETDRSKGSTGATFFVLAKEVISRGGIVFGAAFDSEQDVSHISAESFQDAYRLCGSKYVESSIVNVFLNIENELEKGKEVLFSGLPCQVSAIKRYLKKEYRNLICVALVCYGVPSALVWKSFLREIENNYLLETVCKVNFRKKYQEKRFFEIKSSNKTIIWNDNPYVEGFNKCYYMRESCYECREKDGYSSADIVLGDFWGIENFDKKSSNINSVNCCILLTPKGKKIFKDAKKLKKKESLYGEILIGNPALERSCQVDIEIREYFFKEFILTNNFMKSFDKTKKYVEKLLDVKKKRIEIKGFKVFDQWLTNYRFGKTIDVFFKDNMYQHIAVYGVGRLGKQIISELKETNIKVDYGIDRRSKSINVQDVHVISIEEMPEMEDVDVIVVTPIHVFDRIERQLMEYGFKGDIVSISQIVDYVSKY